MQQNNSLKIELDNRRKERMADLSMLSSNAKLFATDETQNTEMPASRFYVKLGSARIEGFFHRGNIPMLYVMFDGSRSRNRGSSLAPLPTFARWSWYKETNASFISLEDPMFYTFPDCTLGWYYGTKDEDYRKYCAQCISKIADLLNIKNENIVLYGSSGGGTAAIGVSRHLPGCSVVAINSQLFLEKYPYSQELEKIIGINFRSEVDKFERNDNCRIIQGNSESIYFLIENVRSDGDYQTQFLPFCEQININPGFGIEKNRNIVSWLYDAEGAPSTHSSVENSIIFKMIDLLIRHVREHRDLDDIKYIYDVINEFWYERYSLLRTKYYQNKRIENLSAENIKMRDEITLMKKDLDWGWIKAGVKLKKMLGKMKRKVM